MKPWKAPVIPREKWELQKLLNMILNLQVDFINAELGKLSPSKIKAEGDDEQACEI